MDTYKRMLAAVLAAALLPPASGIQGADFLAPAEADAGSRAAVRADPVATLDTVDSIIARWPEKSRVLALITIATYGEPDEFGQDALVWRENRPWKRTVVHRQAPRGRSCLSEDDLLQQAVDYRVPLDKFGELARFDARVEANRARNELSVCSASEQLNFLAANLADEVISGERDSEQARIFQRQTVTLMEAGKTSPYLMSLRFSPAGSKPGTR
ncbi:MAG: hypothetical protein HY926_07855 [Elusimicrobia bacterium]|nr:hypothetical protein [Elusimicrobiota bacterium]